jgi:hypothetical protein
LEIFAMPPKGDFSAAEQGQKHKNWSGNVLVFLRKNYQIGGKSLG